MKTLLISVCGLTMALAATAGCGDSGAGDCLPNDHTQCALGITYWMDSCGAQGTVAEVCDCGCNTEFTGCDQSCTCTPECTGMECGDDGCGGSCGDCNTGESCTTAGQCIVCTPDCAGRVCGDNGCQGSCGTCSGGETCDMAGQCVSCTPDCAGFECGDDGCGGSCGDCLTDETCTAAQLCEATVSDLLIFSNCDVPYVLDAALVSDQAYLVSHFAHLVQQYCVTGSYDGVDITAYPEKMYYGQHDSGNTLSLTQLSLGTGMTPEWTVKVDFSPDTDFTAASVWNASIGGINPPEAYVGLIRHQGMTSMCLKAIGTTGNITVASAVDCTLQEGGSFSLSGQVQLTNPWDIQDYCSQTPANLPCCP